MLFHLSPAPQGLLTKGRLRDGASECLSPMMQTSLFQGAGLASMPGRSFPGLSCGHGCVIVLFSLLILASGGLTGGT